MSSRPATSSLRATVRTSPANPARVARVAIMAMAMLTVALASRPGFARSSSAFSYQALLRENGESVSGSADLRGRLYDAAAGGRQVGEMLTMTNLTVDDGLVTVALDFGTEAVADPNRWLEIDVRSPAGEGSYVTVAPRQRLTAAPLALQTRGIAVGASGDAGVGTIVPQARLDVVAPAAPDDGEGLARAGVADAGGDFLEIGNATGNDGQFIPLVWGHHETDARETFQILGSTTPEQDAGEQALITFAAWQSDGEALIGPVGVRPVFGWSNAGSRLMTMDASGRLGIGTSEPTSTLHVAAPDPFLALRDIDSTGAAQEGWISFRDGTGVERGWFGYGSSGNTDLTLAAGEASLGLVVQTLDDVGAVRIRNAPLVITQSTPTVLEFGSWRFGQRGAGAAADLELRGELHVKTRGSMQFADQTGGVRVAIDADESGHGQVRLYGTNGNLNVWLEADYHDSGSIYGRVSVCDAAGDIQAFMDRYATHQVGVRADIIIADVKNFRVPNPRDPETEIVYACPEGPEAGAYVRGTAHLVDGRAVVELPDYMADVAVSEGMTVHVTPLSADSRGLGVVTCSIERFEVGELFGGDGTYEFDWRVTAVRRGFEDYEVLRPRLMAGDAP